MGQGYGVSRPTRSSGSPDSWIDQCSINLERKLFITRMSLRAVDQFPIRDCIGDKASLSESWRHGNGSCRDFRIPYWQVRRKQQPWFWFWGLWSGLWAAGRQSPMIPFWEIGRFSIFHFPNKQFGVSTTSLVMDNDALGGEWVFVPVGEMS